VAPGARFAAGVAAVACGGLACNQIAGIHEPHDRVPADLLRWEPQPVDAGARVTAVHATAERTYVGFSDGELFFRGNTAGLPWTPMIGESGGCQPPMPQSAVTAIIVIDGWLFVGFAGAPELTKLWRTRADLACWSLVTTDPPDVAMRDVWSVSASPFSGFDVVTLRADSYIAYDYVRTGVWTTASDQNLRVNFGPGIWSLAEGVSASGGRRAWLGDLSGTLFFSDDLGVAMTEESISWTPVDDPRFPPRGVLSIVTIGPQHRERLWITFGGLAGDNVWSSFDNGQSWRSTDGPALPKRAAQLEPQGSFTAVSPVPELPYAYVTALVPDQNGVAVASTFWIATDDPSATWAPR
jgi:hypothetical protein